MISNSYFMCQSADCKQPIPMNEKFMASTLVLHPHHELVKMHNLQLPMPQLHWHSFIMTTLALNGILTWSVNIRLAVCFLVH